MMVCAMDAGNPTRGAKRKEEHLKQRIRSTMPRFVLPVLALTIAWTMAPVTWSLAAEPAPIPLPPPQTDGGKPLMQALGLRATSRAFAPDPIPAQMLSNLLWAAYRPALAKALGLKENQVILLAQCVGRPAR
jgi:hypothetical protein